MAQNLDDWPTFAEAAKELNASLRTMWRYNERGQLEVRKRPQPGKKPVNVVNPRDLEKLKPQPYVLAPEDKNPVEVAVRKPHATAGMAELERIVTILQRQNTSVTIDRKPILKLAEVHALTGIPVGRLKAAIEAGKLKAVLDGEWGRGYRVRRSDLDKYIAQG